jgi:hypothetical protein
MLSDEMLVKFGGGGRWGCVLDFNGYFEFLNFKNVKLFDIQKILKDMTRKNL